MELLFAKTAWEVYDQPLARFLPRAAAAGFTTVEIYLADRPESAAEIRRLLAEHDLGLIAQIATTGPSAADHLASLTLRYDQAVSCGARSVVSHTGRDYFTLEENLTILSEATALAKRQGIPIHHETHRGRALGTGPAALAVLAALPGLELTADLAHWCCAHGSNLADQPAAVAAVIAASRHVHARVGHSEGPQVADPRVPAARKWLDLHTGWWRAIAAARRAAGASTLVVSPEFGPPPYQPVDPATGIPLADPWTLNLWMRDHLLQELAPPTKSAAPSLPHGGAATRKASGLSRA